jgi:hypothetical protein
MNIYANGEVYSTIGFSQFTQSTIFFKRCILKKSRSRMNALKQTFSKHPYSVITLNIIVIMPKLYHFLHEHPVVSGEVVKNIEYISHILCWQA